MFARDRALVRVHAASFPVVLGDGEFGDRTTAAMPVRASFIALTEYALGGGLEPRRGLFSPERLPLPLDPSSFSNSRLAHPRPGQFGVQHFFTSSERPFCLYVVLAGDRLERRRQLTVVDHVLRSLRISPRALPQGA